MNGFGFEVQLSNRFKFNKAQCDSIPNQEYIKELKAEKSISNKITDRERRETSFKPVCRC